MKNKILVILTFIAIFVALATVTGIHQAYLNYVEEKEELKEAMKRVKIVSVYENEAGLLEVKLIPLNKQVHVTIHPLTSPQIVKITDLYFLVHSHPNLKPGSIGEIKLIRDARPFGVSAEFVFIPEDEQIL